MNTLRLGQFKNGRHIVPVPFRSAKWDDADTKDRHDFTSSTPFKVHLGFS